MPRPKQRTGALRDRVLAVAVETLARDGIAGFTTRSVARGANTSTPAVYELFGDKAGLVRGVFFEGFRLLRRHRARAGRAERGAIRRRDRVAARPVARLGRSPVGARAVGRARWLAAATAAPPPGYFFSRWVTRPL
jgi:AcrR family transcriptional regulator